MAFTLTSDPILAIDDAQEIVDMRQESELVLLLNAVSSKARAFMNRVQLNDVGTGNTVVERLRGPASRELFLHAAANTDDFAVDDVVAKVYSGGRLGNTYNASDGELIVTTDEFSTRVDLPAGCFPRTEGGDYVEVTYRGGWATVPAEVIAGAVMQLRVDAKRLRGEVGVQSHSVNGESTQMDRDGLIREVTDLWRSYRMLI